jgi:hypothetical protein
MQRRKFLKTAAHSGLASGGPLPLLAYQTPATSGSGQVHTVLLVTKCHLDVGFTKTQAKAIRQHVAPLMVEGSLGNADTKNRRLEHVDQWIHPRDVVSGGGRARFGAGPAHAVELLIAAAGSVHRHSL